MRSTSASLDDDETSDLLGFLVEFARLLLEAGISSDQFSKLAQVAFLRAASSDARFRNDRINQSAVAAITGLTRTQVRTLLKKERAKAKPTKSSQIDRVISAWLSEAEFLTASGMPKSLRISGASVGFPSLVKKHGGDIPSRALLRELIRRKLVGVNGDYVTLAASARRRHREKRLGQISSALESVLKRPRDQRDVRSIKVATFEVSHLAPAAIGRVLLRKRIAKSLQAFMADVEAACAAVALEVPPRSEGPKRLSKTGVFLITQD
jgi:hypothetical protein